MDGSSFRVPQCTDQRRLQIADTWTMVFGSHTMKVGGEFQRVDAGFGLDVFRAGRVELVQDFPAFDANGDGQVDDNDLLFAVTLRSGHPESGSRCPDCDNNHGALFVQDDWRVSSHLTLNLGLRYEVDTNVKNISGYGDINPIAQPFLQGDRQRGQEQLRAAPRLQLVHRRRPRPASMAATASTTTASRWRSCRSSAGSTGARCRSKSAPATCSSSSRTASSRRLRRRSATRSRGFMLPGAGAGGINIIDNSMQNPEVQQFNLGVEHNFGGWLARIDGIHTHGTHFIIGRTIGAVFNPVVGGPDPIVNLESSVGTKYDALLVSAERTFRKNFGLRASYTLAKAFNYANDDQIPFSAGPIDPSNLQLEYGPTPNDQRHRFTLAGVWSAPKSD